MLRSAASPGSVGFGRFGGGVSGLLMTPLPAGHLHERHDLKIAVFPPRQACSAPSRLTRKGRRPAPSSLKPRAAYPSAVTYLIFASRNSTCFLATGSYFFFKSLSVMVREFL